LGSLKLQQTTICQSQSPIEETPVEKTGKSESKKNKKEQEAKNNTHKDQRARIHENNTRDKIIQFESMAQHGSDHIKIIHLNHSQTS